MPSSPTATLGISIPETLRAQIYTAVPPAELVKLMKNSYRSSLAADFAAGSTPAWYQVSLRSCGPSAFSSYTTIR